MGGVIRNAASMGTYEAEWEAHGYCGAGNVRELLDSLTGRSAIICGNAHTVFEDLKEAEAKLQNPVIFGVNDVGMYLPRMDHWVSLHSDNLGVWKAVRWLTHREREVTKYHSSDPRPYIDYEWARVTPMFALSGYFAMQVAWMMGARPIVLCGCPGRGVRRFFEGTPRTDFNYGDGGHNGDNSVRQQVEHEMERLPDFKAAVRSMSGWTEEFFGRL